MVSLMVPSNIGDFCCPDKGWGNLPAKLVRRRRSYASKNSVSWCCDPAVEHDIHHPADLTDIVRGHHEHAARLRDYLLTHVWDDHMGRFKSSASTNQIFVDNQTWGAAFLKAQGREADARRALSYAHWMLPVQSNTGQLCGFDGAGPFSVWNEGTLQYVADRGENSQTYFDQVASQQASDGGLPNSPDDFLGYIVWLSRWHGIAPTAWLYFAGTRGPFQTIQRMFLPIVVR